MKLPTQANPVVRQQSQMVIKSGIQPSVCAIKILGTCVVEIPWL